MQRENGIVIGTVSDLKDPEQIGRVRVTFPQYADKPSDWARVVSPMAGKDRGFFFQPEVGDEVLVAFENGDPRRAYILGALWSKVDTPPPRDGNDAQNNLRLMKSRSGHIVTLDDTSGKEKIVVVDKSGANSMTWDAANNKITIESGRGDLEIKAPAGTLTITGKTVEIKATADMTVQASAQLTVKGLPVNIN